MTAPREDLVEALRRDWPDAWNEELAGELEAFLADRPASLPSVRGSAVYWATTAPEERALRFATEDIRAWLVPAFVVEEGLRTLGSATGELGERLLECSPAGYLAWRCSMGQADTVRSKLKTLRHLLEGRPEVQHTHSRSLIELRRRFETALAGGDRASAGEIVENLAQTGSETASNVLFMRVRMWDRFREYEEIVHPDRVRTLASIALPSKIRIALVRAHFWRVVAPHADPRDRLEAYTQSIEPLMGSVVASCHPKDSDEVAQCMVFRAAARGDTELAARLFDEINDPSLRGLLEGLRPPEAKGVEPTTSLPADRDLAEGLTWEDLCRAFAEGNWVAVESFLEDKERPSLADAPATTRGLVVESLMEVHTSPDASGLAADLVRATTIAAVEDIRADSRFPRSALRQLYKSLLELWQEIHAGSGNTEDRAVFLLLLAATLQIDPTAVSHAIDAIHHWWGARSCHSTDDFLIQCLDSLAEYADDMDALRGLWYAGVARAKGRGTLRAADRRHWIALGTNLGIDATTLSELAPPPSDLPQEEVDPLSSCPYQRIAIVSGREAPARVAAEQIESRSGAGVYVVSSSVADDATDRACGADCILLVWSAISHAVFRAFDSVRDKIVYVPGTGASSIIMALERSVD